MKTVAIAAFLWIALAPLQAEEKITFEDDIEPLLSIACANCHNPDDQKGGFDVTSHAALLAGGSGGSVVSGGDPSGSRLLAILRQDEAPRMPPNGAPMAEADIAVVEAWIAGGVLESRDSQPRKTMPNPDLVFEGGSGRPEGAAPMPESLPCEPVVTTDSANTITALATSPWAPLVAVGGERQVLLYHLEDLELLGILPFPEGGPTTLSFSANGRYLLAGGGRHARDGKVAVWDITRGQRLLTLGEERDVVLAAAVRPDLGAVTIGGPPGMIRVYHPGEIEPVNSIKKHADWIVDAAYSPDGRYLATGDRHGALHVWEAEGAGEVFAWESHENGVTQIAWRPDGKVLASVGNDGALKLWEMKDGKRVKEWKPHQPGVLAVDWSTAGPLVTGGRDRRARVWQADGKKLAELPEMPDIVTAVAIDHTGQRVVAGDFVGNVRVFDVERQVELGSLRANPASD